MSRELMKCGAGWKGRYDTRRRIRLNLSNRLDEAAAALRPQLACCQPHCPDADVRKVRGAQTGCQPPTERGRRVDVQPINTSLGGHLLHDPPR